jgi:hypothetical protein
VALLGNNTFQQHIKQAAKASHRPRIRMEGQSALSGDASDGPGHSRSEAGMSEDCEAESDSQADADNPMAAARLLQDLSSIFSNMDATYESLDTNHSGVVDLEESGPTIYKALQNMHLGHMWETLTAAADNGTEIPCTAFSKVYLTWVGIDEQFEVEALNPGDPLAISVSWPDRGCFPRCRLNKGNRHYPAISSSSSVLQKSAMRTLCSQ